MKLAHPDPKDFQSSINGKKTSLYLLSNTSGISLTICNYGGRIVSLHAPDRDGSMADIVCGFNSLDEYLRANESYHGALIGRYANRIANARFSIDETEYKLAPNNGPNSLHGGPGGFHNVVWDVIKHTSTELELEYLSKDMEEGFPGNLTTRVHYELNNNNELIITYFATTDKKTVINFTNHAYFNLAGEANGDIYNHAVSINASYFTELNEFSIPTGKLLNVGGTPFDFRKPKTIEKDLGVDHIQLKYGNGYDHNFLLDNAEPGVLVFAAEAVEPDSGRKIRVYTTEPAMQLYIASHFNGSDKGKSGQPYIHRGAIALETQHYPDSPNQPYFPTTLLKPGEEFHSRTIFKFGLV
jgi:aldose 1-epimerase